MAKSKTVFVCAECGGEHSKWPGQCKDCKAWKFHQGIGRVE